MPLTVDTRADRTTSCADQTNTAYDALEVGDSLEIVADHDPAPLYYMLKAERGDTFTWDLETAGPDVWRATVVRTTA
jgi:uncharacterized protein (DUF2249 family)